MADKTDEIVVGPVDVFAETEAARLISDDVVIAKAISDASMLAVAPSMTPPSIQIPPPPALPQDLEEDAYFHPGGEIRSIATPNEAIRVADEASAEKKLRAKARRSWMFTMVVAIALPIVLVAIIVAIGRTTTLGESSAIQAAAVAGARAPRIAADSRTQLAAPVGLRASRKGKPAVQRPARPAFGGSGRRSSR